MRRCKQSDSDGLRIQGSARAVDVGVAPLARAVRLGERVKHDAHGFGIPSARTERHKRIHRSRNEDEMAAFDRPTSSLRYPPVPC
jgi:hypothetical protein